LGKLQLLNRFEDLFGLKIGGKGVKKWIHVDYKTKFTETSLSTSSQLANNTNVQNQLTLQRAQLPSTTFTPLLTESSGWDPVRLSGDPHQTPVRLVFDDFETICPSGDVVGTESHHTLASSTDAMDSQHPDFWTHFEQRISDAQKTNIFTLSTQFILQREDLVAKMVPENENVVKNIINTREKDSSHIRR
jgi:hypothetical protein